MTLCMVLSDQSYNWSDTYQKTLRFLLAAKATRSATQTVLARWAPARLIDRAIQALWQTRLQMRRRCGTRSQILFVSEPRRRRTTANDLRAPRLSRSHRSVCRKLPALPNDSRGDLRNQSRAAKSQREARVGHRANDFPSGSRNGRGPSGQHGSVPARSASAQTSEDLRRDTRITRRGATRLYNLHHIVGAIWTIPHRADDKPGELP